MSAFFGALTISLLYLTIQKLTKKYVVALAASLILAFSQLFWLQSLFAESYTLNSFFVVLLVLILLHWLENRKIKYLYWFSFLYGLSLTNHTMMLLLAPALVLYVVLVDRQVIKNIRLLAKMFLFFLLGVSVYLYLPWRSSQNPQFLWTKIDDWQTFLFHLTRKQYGDLEIFGQFLSKLLLVKEFLLELVEQFFWPGILAALIGFIALVKKSYQVAILTFTIFIFNSLGIIFLRQVGTEAEIHQVYRVYYLPAFIMLVLWMGLLFSWLIDFFTEKLKFQKAMIGVLLILFLVLPFYLFTVNLEKNNLSDFWLTYDYAKETLAHLESDAVLFYFYNGTVDADTEIFNLVYLKMVENFRTDVSIISEHNFFYKDFNLEFPPTFYRLTFTEKRDELLKLVTQIENENIYSNNILNQKNNILGFFSLANGIVYKIYPNLEEAKEAETKIAQPQLRNLEDEKFRRDDVIKKLIAHHYYNLATLYLNQGNEEKSNFYLSEAISLFSSQEYLDFLEYKKIWR